MGIQPHVLAEVDVRDASVVLNDQHVFIVRFGAGVAKVGGPHDHDWFGRQGIDQHEFEMHPLNMDIARELVEFSQPLIETIERYAVAMAMTTLGSACSLRMAAI